MYRTVYWYIIHKPPIVVCIPIRSGAHLTKGISIEFQIRSGNIHCVFLQIISVKKKSTHTKTIFYFVGCIISLNYSNDQMTIFIQLWNKKIYNIIEIVYKHMLEKLYTGQSAIFFASLLLNVAVALIVFLFYIMILPRYVNYRHYQSLQNPRITFVPCCVIHTLDVSVLFSKNKSQKTPLSSPTGHGMGVFC